MAARRVVTEVWATTLAAWVATVELAARVAVERSRGTVYPYPVGEGDAPPNCAHKIKEHASCGELFWHEDCMWRGRNIGGHMRLDWNVHDVILTSVLPSIKTGQHP
eukprot:3798558-Prymnesium_polylepis.1